MSEKQTSPSRPSSDSQIQENQPKKLLQVLIVEDDAQMNALLKDFLSNQGYSVFTSDSATSALELLKQKRLIPDVIVSDIHMPQMNGLEFTTQVKVLNPSIPVILITAFGSVETAVDAIKRGAFHYIVKPFKLTELEVGIERALESSRLKRENISLKQQFKSGWGRYGIIGKSPSMESVYDLIERVSRCNTNVLITGESGTGKEMIARAIHDNSSRTKMPFIAINCTAIPESLLESELFGHAKGSFTGAVQRKRGLFEEAEGGTIFLDEIGDMDLTLQSKLLRVIQERTIRAVGENITRPVDVRIVSATHRDLRLAMKEGRFREDLYYRLSVIPIVVPPLRQRKEDIPVLASHFLQKYGSLNSSNVTGFTNSAIQKLIIRKWTGNVRELENVIERAVVLSNGPMIDDVDIPTPGSESPEDFFFQATGDFPSLQDLEKRYIEVVLEKTGGRKDRTAQILGINRRTLYRKERDYGLVDDGSVDDGSVNDGLADDASTGEGRRASQPHQDKLPLI